MTNNKKIGTDFENEMCNKLKDGGYWTHFITPDNRGAQPFDIIAAKDGMCIAIDCKTCVANTFSIDRLEDNQIYAFDKWLQCGNTDPIIAVKHNEKIIIIKYSKLKQEKKIKLADADSYRQE